ncbi:UNVERIFIED_CONTAM: hypothetical protein FKN15_045491, partial [Acipenser sinensis]
KLFYFPLVFSLVLQSVRAQQLLQGSCRFEQGTCGYNSDPEYLKWVLDEEGHYITADSAFGGAGQKAVLIGPDLELLEWGCMRLVYQITGSGSLKMYVRPEGESFDYLLWSALDPSDSWLIASIDLRNTTNRYKIIFVASPGQKPEQSVAIFEILIVPGYCVECNFEEHHLCGYMNYWNPNVNWYVGGSTIRDGQSNLPFDHTMNNERGSFLLANTRLISRTGYVGRLYGPYLPGTLKYCLRFYYALHGFIKTDNTLAVYIYDENNMAQEKVWTVSESPMGYWIQVEVNYQKLMPTKVTPYSNSVTLFELKSVKNWIEVSK